jgi:hypothetical protein
LPQRDEGAKDNMDAQNILSEFLSSFNNREIAILIWLAILVVYVLSAKPLRNSVKALMKAFFEKHISTTLLTLIVYTVLEVTLLKQVLLWDYALLKDTIAWVLFVAFGLIMSLATDRMRYKLAGQFFKSVLWVSIKLILVFEFVVNLYAFNLILEFIFIGLMSVIAMMSAVAGFDKKHWQVQKVCDYIMSIYGISILAYSGYRIFADFSGFATFETLKSFMLPLLLTVLYIPYLYVLSLVFAYEDIFIRLTVFFRDNQGLRRVAKWEAIKSCLLNINKFQKFKTAGFLQLLEAKTEQDVIRIIRNLKEPTTANEIDE